MSALIKNLALIIKSDTQEGLETAKNTVDILGDLGCTMYLPFDDKVHIGDKECIVYTEEENVFSDAECVIVFGGDGTIMRAAHKTTLPILGINLGRIGYIAELETNELHLLAELVNGNYTVENRMMLSYGVEKNGVYEEYAIPALNEIVLSKGGHSVMPEIELICNGEEVGKYFADGLICSTPTGSTAYSLAAGGSIIDPGMECFAVSQICPQSFYAKPLVFGGNSILEFRKGKRGHGKLFLTSDGEFVTEIEEGDSVKVSKGCRYTRFVKIKKNNFYSVMRSKMTEI